MKIKQIPITLLTILSSAFVSQAAATICQPYTMEHEKQIHFSATNCHAFSGSKALKTNQSGSLFNVNQEGDYNDNLYGHSYIYCPITEQFSDNIQAAEVAVSDASDQHDVVCQLGQTQYTERGFATYWGSKARSTGNGDQVITSHQAQIRKKSNGNTNTFVTCALPPQDIADAKASSLNAYVVSQRQSTH